MDVQVVAGLAGLVGLVTGVAAALAVRVSERAEQPSPRPPASGVPPGVASVLAVLPSSAVVLDSAGRVLRASSAARAIGLVRGDQLAVDEVAQLAYAVRRDGEIREAEIEVRGGRGRFGSTSELAVRVAPLGVDLVLVLAEDRTELHRVAAVRRDFVANVSHELKTPVGALSLLAETVEGAADDPEAVRRFAGRMRHEASRLTNLVRELITLSRIEGGDPMPEPAVVSVDGVVTEAFDRCRLAASAKDIELVTGVRTGLSVLGDEDLLVTALRNLVDNAIAYSPEHTRVVISVRRAGRVAEISVTDQGIGIPEHDLRRIFERFYRVDRARSRATGGTGLGLAIVKHVTTNHGGEVTVRSREGAGSTFTIRLPTYEPGQPPGSHRPGSRDHEPGPSRRRLREATS